jgi:2-iminobutanoate/2-iminopropanoate deaminase
MNKSFSFVSLILLSTLRLHGLEQMKETVSITAIQSPDLPSPIGPFSQAIKVSGALKEILFISGQLPINPKNNLLEHDPAKATEQCMHNLAAILKEADMDFSNVVKTTILLTDIADFPVVNEAYKNFLTTPYPARVTFQAGALPKGARVEIEMTAVK